MHIEALQLLHTFQAYKEAAETEMAKKGQEIGSEVSFAICINHSSYCRKSLSSLVVCKGGTEDS